MTPAGPSVAAPAALDEALAAAAEACCGALPADGEWSGSIADGQAPAVPGAGAQAVAATPTIRSSRPKAARRPKRNW